MRENETRVQEWAAPCAKVLDSASYHLAILDPEGGEEVLIQAVAAALANLRMPKTLTGRMVPPSTMRQGPGGG